MSVWLLVNVLCGLVAVGGLIRIAISIMRLQQAKARMEPENSHPGRVIPHGVPIIRALKDAAGDLRELQDQPSPHETGKGYAPERISERDLLQHYGSPSYFNLKPFRPGQWVRTSWAALAQIVSSGGEGWYSYRSETGEAGSAGIHLVPAMPRMGEWWQKRRCPKSHPLPKDTHWSDGPVKWCYTVGDYTSLRCGTSKPNWDALFAGERDACECGCLAPVNFGLGEAPHHETTER